MKLENFYVAPLKSDVEYVQFTSFTPYNLR